MLQNRPVGSRSFIIFKKEFREIFRDKRTMMLVVISPLIITPALFALMGTWISGETEKVRTQTYKIGLVGADTAPVLTKALKAAPHFEFTEVSKDEAENRIKDHKLNAAVVLPPDADARMVAGNSVSVQLLEDAGDMTSGAASGRVSATLNAIGQQLLVRRLSANNLPADFATPFRITTRPIEKGGSAATGMLAMFLPYMLTISAIGGAIYASFDQVAGEKERGTLETLLVSPASRRDIVFGKFSAVVMVCLISSFLSIVGLVISFSTRSKALEWLAKDGLKVSPGAIGVTLLVMIPIAVLFAGLLLGVSTFARNQKEAQTYITPVMLLVMMPALASMFIGTDVPLKIAFVPVLNASIIIKQALSGNYNTAFIALAFLASVVYAAIALTMATRLFQKESILIKA